MVVIVALCFVLLGVRMNAAEERLAQPAPCRNGTRITIVDGKAVSTPVVVCGSSEPAADAGRKE